MRCKNQECREKFEAKKFLQKYCNKTECQILERTSIALKNLEKIKKDKKQEIKINAYSKEYKKELQNNINKLARMIDLHFHFTTCIDCGKPYGKQQDGGHFDSVGNNPTLRFNLHNIHSQKSDCNRNGLGGGKQLGYRRGLEKRYSVEYADFIEFDLKQIYTSIRLTENEIYEKLTIVRKIIKEFETFELKSSFQAREYFNNLIGIY